MQDPDVRAGACCAPSGGRTVAVGRSSARSVRAPQGRPVADDDGLVRLSGGTFTMGSQDRDANPHDGEGPLREVRLSAFRISATAVTNAEFGEFVRATGYTTGAEQFGWSYVFAGFLPAHLRRGAARPEQTPWWCAVQGACWSAPEGPGSAVTGRADHPVVHVDHHDAVAYCAWAGLRLPTEAEWEYAARGGLTGARFPWGSELLPDGRHRCNIWQGRFPTHDTGDDGYRGTAPVTAYAPNGFGLHNMAGNVWEWCSDRWTTDHSAGSSIDPQGPPRGAERVMKGGSYLCHDSYCNRYRVAARSRNDPGSSSGNVGFRCARNR